MRRSLRAGMIVLTRHLLLYLCPPAISGVRQSPGRNLFTRAWAIPMCLLGIAHQHAPNMPKISKSNKAANFLHISRLPTSPQRVSFKLSECSFQLPQALGFFATAQCMGATRRQGLGARCVITAYGQHFTCRQIAPQAVTRQKAVFQAVSG